ncbi:diguanylate cyclase [Acidiphilium sp.]|uniref:GGDEF domain-containing protein n=1 Tax=Acidiphilium sp. TaxID=527 RepID=UPI003D051F22
MSSQPPLTTTPRLSLILGTEYRQRLALQMMLSAAVIYGLCLLQLWYAVLTGLPVRGAAVLITIIDVIGQIVFYVAIRSGFSRRFADQSISLPQMALAILSLAYSFIFFAPQSVGLPMLSALVIQYGGFRLTPRQCHAVGWMTVLVFGIASVCANWYDPRHLPVGQAATDFFFFLITMPMIGFVAASLSTLRLKRRQERAELRDALARVQQLATRDDLTGQPNRRYALEWLGRELGRRERRGGRLCFALIDLDHFKSINDTYGHDVGDEVLRSFARAADAVLRAESLFARWGGEEFLLIMPDATVAEVTMAVERLRAEFTRSRTHPAVMFSAGISDHRSGEAIEATLRRADQALYQAKNQGRNRSVLAA